MSEKKQEELSRIGERYPVLASKATAKAVAEVLRENVGENVGQFDFQKIKWPTGEQKHLDVPSVSGEGESVKKLTGLIVFQKAIRALYLTDDVSNQPPACSSMDGKNGFGVLGFNEQPAQRQCATCPMFGFGTKCHPKAALFILREGQSLPTLLTVPRTSLKVLRQYLLGLASIATPYWLVETELQITTDKNAAGKPFARGVFKMARKLEAGERDAANAYHKAIQGIMGGAAPVPLDDAPTATDDSELH